MFVCLFRSDRAIHNNVITRLVLQSQSKTTTAQKTPSASTFSIFMVCSSMPWTSGSGVWLSPRSQNMTKDRAGLSALPRRSDRRAQRPRQRRLRRGDAPFYPEGGWGYVVVLAAFAALMTQMGLIVSMGVYLERIEEEFESGAGLSGWISSGCFAVLAFVSPLASHVMKRLGCRATAMIGGAIMCVGFVCGTFASSIVQLFLTADVIGGIGASLCHISGTVVIGQYFNRRYALANGFAYTGQGVGIFMFPPILQSLINTYGWRGCMLVQGALSLHISVAAALYRPVKQPSGTGAEPPSGASERNGETDSTAVSAREPDSPGVGPTTSPTAKRRDAFVRPALSESRMENPTAVSATGLGSYPTDSTKDLHSTGSQSHTNNLGNGKEQFQPEPTEDTRFLTDFHTAPKTPFSASSTPPGNGCALTVTSSGIRTVVTGTNTNTSREFEIDLVEDQESVALGAGGRGGRGRKCLVAWRMVRRHPSILFVFLIFLFETFGYGGYFSHVVAKARETGIEDGAATFALSVFGIGSLVGRITSGLVLHSGRLTGKGLNALALVTAGGASAVTSAAAGQAGLFAGAFFSGLGSGWYLPLQQVLLRNIVGQARLHLAYGYGMLFEGVGSLLGGYVIGAIRDGTGSYEVSFYFLGVVMVLGACVLAVDRHVERRGLCRGKDRGGWAAFSPSDAEKKTINGHLEEATPV